jgi:hypothetical protein
MDRFHRKGAKNAKFIDLFTAKAQRTQRDVLFDNRGGLFVFAGAALAAKNQGTRIYFYLEQSGADDTATNTTFAYFCVIRG